MSTFTRNYSDLKMIERSICNKVDSMGLDIESFISKIDKDGRCRQVIRRHIIRVRGYDIDSMDYLTGNH